MGQSKREPIDVRDARNYSTIVASRAMTGWPKQQLHKQGMHECMSYLSSHYYRHIGQPFLDFLARRALVVASQRYRTRLGVRVPAENLIKPN
jgi:hypothetical protein